MLDSQPNHDAVRGSAGRSLDRSLLSQVTLFTDLKPSELAGLEQLCRYRRFSIGSMSSIGIVPRPTSISWCVAVFGSSTIP